MGVEDTGSKYPRSLDEILVDLGAVRSRMSDPEISNTERSENHDWHIALRREAAAARRSLPVDRDRVERRIVEIERLIEKARQRHMDPSMAAVGESGGGGVDAYMLITNNTRIDAEAGVDRLVDERRRLMDRLAEPE